MRNGPCARWADRGRDRSRRHWGFPITHRTRRALRYSLWASLDPAPIALSADRRRSPAPPAVEPSRRTPRRTLRPAKPRRCPFARSWARPLEYARSCQVRRPRQSERLRDRALSSPVPNPAESPRPPTREDPRGALLSHARRTSDAIPERRPMPGHRPAMSCPRGSARRSGPVCPRRPTRAWPHDTRAPPPRRGTVHGAPPCSCPFLNPSRHLGRKPRHRRESPTIGRAVGRIEA